MFESRHSDYLKEAEKPHFQGQYLEDAVFRCFIENFVEFSDKALRTGAHCGGVELCR